MGDPLDTADRLAGALRAGPGLALALLGPEGRGKPWLAMQVARLCGLHPVRVDGRDLSAEPAEALRSSLASLAPGTCVVVNFIDAATPAVLAELARAAQRVAVIGCGPELPPGHDPEAWSVVRSTEEWRPLFERDEPPTLSPDLQLD